MFVGKNTKLQSHGSVLEGLQKHSLELVQVKMYFPQLKTCFLFVIFPTHTLPLLTETDQYQ